MIDLLVFSAPYCGPCKSMESAGVYQAVVEAGYTIHKIDTQESPEIADQYGVFAIPTIIIRKDGSPVRRLIGAKTKSELLAELKLSE
jgi:thioredoxin 1